MNINDIVVARGRISREIVELRRDYDNTPDDLDLTIPEQLAQLWGVTRTYARRIVTDIERGEAIAYASEKRLRRLYDLLEVIGHGEDASEILAPLDVYWEAGILHRHDMQIRSPVAPSRLREWDEQYAPL